jgi:hypothetical protein
VSGRFLNPLPGSLEAMAKTFDCVAMKHDIQQKLRERYGKTPWTERNVIVREAIRADPHLSRLFEIARLSSTEPESRPSGPDSS